jgi:hypothetical protein
MSSLRFTGLVPTGALTSPRDGGTWGRNADDRPAERGRGWYASNTGTSDPAGCGPDGGCGRGDRGGDTGRVHRETGFGAGRSLGRDPGDRWPGQVDRRQRRTGRRGGRAAGPARSSSCSAGRAHGGSRRRPPPRPDRKRTDHNPRRFRGHRGGRRRRCQRHPGPGAHRIPPSGRADGDQRPGMPHQLADGRGDRDGRVRARTRWPGDGRRCDHRADPRSGTERQGRRGDRRHRRRRPRRRPHVGPCRRADAVHPQLLEDLGRRCRRRRRGQPERHRRRLARHRPLPVRRRQRPLAAGRPGRGHLQLQPLGRLRAPGCLLHPPVHRRRGRRDRCAWRRSGGPGHRGASCRGTGHRAGLDPCTGAPSARRSGACTGSACTASGTDAPGAIRTAGSCPGCTGGACTGLA